MKATHEKISVEESAELIQRSVNTNPLANMSKEDIVEFSALVGEEAERGSAHRKQMRKLGLEPIPPRDWLTCPFCEKEIERDGVTKSGRTKPYRAPQSLVNHIREHGGLNKASADWGMLPEQVTTVNPKLQARFVLAGIAGRDKFKELENIESEKELDEIVEEEKGLKTSV